MGRTLQNRALILRSQRMPWILLGSTLLILAGVILFTTQQTRSRIRSQIVGRDREILHAMAQMLMPRDGAADEVVGSIDDPANQMPVILETSRMSGVMGARLFDPAGRFIEGFPADLVVAVPSARDLAALRTLKPVSHFLPSVALSELFLLDAGQRQDGRREVPVLEVSVPLHTASDGRLVGIAQFVIEGFSIAQEFALLDQHLWQQALIAFLAGAVVLSAVMAWAFRRLRHAHRLLAERTEHLLEANQELALAAKTSAVGAVTSHLIHGLRNPLAGLQNFVSGLGAAVADHPDADLQQAIAATRRMQAMINEVVGVLREEESAGQYEIAVPELVELITGKVQGLGRERGVNLRAETTAEAMLPNRAANLVALILVNLVQNAIEATPRQGEVRLRIDQSDEQLICQVRDQGRGFPAGRQPFVPCQSDKEGGSGIGLAISKQLANHLGAGLELAENSASGCLFVLCLPDSLWKPKTRSITVTLG
jgi:signal transduction histidine kinase